MTLYNDVVRRPHLPREHTIRRIILNTGIDLSLYGPPPRDDEESSPNLEEEDGESEEEEDDPCFLVAFLLTCAYCSELELIPT